MGYKIWLFYINTLIFYWFIRRPNFQTIYEVEWVIIISNHTNFQSIIIGVKGVFDSILGKCPKEIQSRQIVSLSPFRRWIRFDLNKVKEKHSIANLHVISLNNSQANFTSMIYRERILPKKFNMPTFIKTLTVLEFEGVCWFVGDIQLLGFTLKQLDVMYNY